MRCAGNTMRTILSSLLACVLLSQASAIEISPLTPPEHSLVRIAHSDGAAIFVMTVRNGMIAEVDTLACPGMLVFTGPPGVYAIFGNEDGQRVQEYVTIGKGVNPPPKPDDPVDPVDPDDPSPDFGRFGVGKLSYSLNPDDKTNTKSTAEVFIESYYDLKNSRKTITQTNDAIRAKITSLPPAWNQWRLGMFGKFQELSQSRTVSTKKDHSDMYSEMIKALKARMEE